MSHSIFGITPASLTVYWPQIKPHIERFCDETRLVSVGEIMTDVMDRTKQLWGVQAGEKTVGFLLTEISDRQKGRTMCVWGAAGTAEDVEHLAPIYTTLETWAREIGCTVVEVRGRKGWSRVLPGFKETGVLLEKVLA